MIPAEAIEAAQEAVKDAMIEHGPDGHIDGYQEIARAALEAAAPHMLAEAWNEGFTDAYYLDRGYDLDGRQTFELPENLKDDVKAWNRYRNQP